MRKTLTCLCLVGIVIFHRPARGANPPAPATGKQHLVFAERSPVSSLDEFARRAQRSVESIKQGGPNWEYDLAGESFEAYIPKAARPNDPHGLLVWIGADDAALPTDWPALLDRQKLIWISPNKAGNDRDPIVRIGLALDAVHNMAQRYPIDEKRIYIAGFSGGGRAASIAAVGYPDVFTGGMFMMGCNFYRRLPFGGGGKFYPPNSFRPPDELFEQAKTRPLVLMTSERDMNRAQTQSTLGGFKEDGFERVTLIDVPAIGHQIPAASWAEKGLKALSAHPTTAPAR